MYGRGIVLCLPFLLILFCVCISSVQSNFDPCDTKWYINDWKRSVAYTPDIPDLCDSFLEENWYRVVSGAGELMPTECPRDGWRCGTMNPVWLSGDGVADGENVYPEEGKTVDRIAYTSSAFGNCKDSKYPIKIKNCGQHFVYYLVPVKGCNSAYCFGKELPCPKGKSSDTGFTPGCASSPEVNVTADISVDIHEDVINNAGASTKLHYTPKFICSVLNPSENYTYDVRFFINDIEIRAAAKKDVTFENLHSVPLYQGHWEKSHKPNMFVRCSIQVRMVGFDSPGPKSFSKPFFAGIKIPDVVKGFQVDEGQSLQIPVEVTLPIGCIVIQSDNPQRTNYIKEHVCFVHLFNAVPKYQKDTERCNDGIMEDDIKFVTQQCGVKISHSKWNKRHHITVKGEADNKVNIRDRLAHLRLWSDPQHKPVDVNVLDIWDSVYLPDVKILVKDKEKHTLGKECYSHNDPHMRTFDQKTWELQNRFSEPSPGEYIMYKHERLPEQINAFFRACNSGGKALCNCGVAVRSGNSLFVANFCETRYKGQRRVNRYIASWLCDDQNLSVVENGNRFTVMLPSGTRLVFSHGAVYDFYGIHNIDISPSLLDVGMTTGLCGRYNDNDEDDFIERGTGIIQQNAWHFAKSWKVDNTPDSFFNPYGKIPELKYHLQVYCTCTAEETATEPPKYTCINSNEMKKCRTLEISKSVFKASCLASNYRTKRDVGDESESQAEDFDNRPPMFPTMVEPDEDHVGSDEPPEWADGLSEEIARNRCQNAFKQSLAFSACKLFVPVVNADAYVDECVKDMKIIGDDRFLRVTLENYATACLGSAKKMENLTKPANNNDTSIDNTQTNGTESSSTEEGIQLVPSIPNVASILEIIEKSTCPANCSGNGICEKGVCKCQKDYFGVDCSKENTRAPIIQKSAFEDDCDISERPCKKFVIPGLDFYPENLTCKFREFEIFRNETNSYVEQAEATFTHPGIYSSLFLMMCKIPEERRKRSVEGPRVASGYYISVSNDGVNFTEEVMVLAFDRRCYDCNVTALRCSKEFKEDCPYYMHTDVIDDDDNGVTTWIIVVVVLAVLVTIMIIVFCVRKWSLKQRKYSIKEDIPLSTKEPEVTELERITLLEKKTNDEENVEEQIK